MTVQLAGKADKSYVDSENGVQNATLANHGSRISTNETDINNLEADNTHQWQHINENTDILAQHTRHLDTLDKGVAIAMSLPDVWLSDTKSFGIFGSVGGYNGETAFGLAAIGRIDETWSLNAKLGADTSFQELGWQVGAGAQW